MGDKGTKFTLLIASTLTTMSSAAISPSLPNIALAFESNPKAVLLSKLIVTVPALLIALSAPFAGKWIDIQGRLRLFIIGLVIYTVSGTSGFFLNDLYLILVGRALLGISIGIIMTVVTTLIGDYFEGKARLEIMGLKTAYVAIGGMMFVSVGGFLADISWRFPFLLYSMSIFVLLLVFKYLKEPTREIHHSKEKGEKGASMRLVIVFSTAFIVMLLFYMIPVQIPFQMKEIGIDKSSMTGVALAINTLAVAIGSILFRKIKTRINFPTLFSMGFALIGGGYLLIWLATNFALMVSGMVVSGIGLGFILPGVGLWMLELSTTSDRGRNTGILTTSMFLGAFASPIATQPLISSSNLSSTFGMVAAFSIGLAIAFILSNLIPKRTN